jgi:hypothetical protein
MSINRIMFLSAAFLTRTPLLYEAKALQEPSNWALAASELIGNSSRTTLGGALPA